MAVTKPEGIRIAIDRGGTFTDCVAQVPNQDDIVIKLLSVDPNNYPDAPTEAIRRVLERATGKSYPKGEKISLKGVGMFSHFSVWRTVLKFSTTSGATFISRKTLTLTCRIHKNGNDSSYKCAAGEKGREDSFRCHSGLEGPVAHR